MKKPAAANPSVPIRKPMQRKGVVSDKAIIDRLVARHELTELEASWLLKAWKLGGVARTHNHFACYLAGFMAGIAFKAVEQEVKSTRN